MPEITLKLLADLNHDKRDDPSRTLEPKFIALITAAQLNTYFQYSSVGKKHPIVVDPASVLQLDEIAQRGVNDDNHLLQDDKKMQEIANSLLGEDDNNPRAYLGTLVWNVRDAGTNGFQRAITSIEGQPPIQDLKFHPTHIYLTDSAHRHLGICEAFKKHAAAPAKYPRFDPNYEFAVEIYNLDKIGEKQLFQELNSKQKKITAAKQKQVDVTTPLGVLKEKIIELDQHNDRLFARNIEVNSNTNDRHTLMTMSVFTASIKEMYPQSLINECKDDDTLCEELAQHYCDFFYSLRDTIEIECEIRGSNKSVYPFKSLYLEHIIPIEDGDYEDEQKREDELQTARDRASKFNDAIRSQDILLKNSMIKGLSYIGGQVRFMKDWDLIVAKIQTDLVLPSGGKYFQATNPEMLEVNPETGHSIATLKDDGTLNVQVQSHTIRTIKIFLSEKLDLIREPLLIVDPDGIQDQATGDSFGRTVLLNDTGETNIDLQIDLFVGSQVSVATSDLKLRVEPMLNGESWNAAKFVGQNSLTAARTTIATGFSDPSHGDKIKKIQARFELDLPMFDKPHITTFPLKLTFTYPGLNGDEEKVTVNLPCQKTPPTSTPSS
jgi:hypothetical protein